LDMTVKTTPLRIPRPSGILILNLTILVVLALVVSHQVSHDPTSQIDSASRAAHKRVQAVVAQIQDQRVVSDGSVLPQIPLKYASWMVGCLARFD
jgi:hypothetical protein